MGRFRTHAVAALVTGLLVTLLTGCFTGERPTLAPAVAEVTDPAVAAVVDLLEVRHAEPFTATYTIVTRLGSEVIPPTSASVSQTSATARSITIGNIRYLDQDGVQQTCNLAAASCPTGLDDAQISNLLVTHEFYASAPAARLRQDALTMVGAAIASTRDIAGRTATCVQVNFAAGIKVYCALANGLLAFQDTPDLQIDLLSIADTADPALFTTTTVAGG